MSPCFPLFACLRRFRCRSRNRRCGKKPENYLTPYEMEMVPMMLKELTAQSPRFFETVSFRWFKEAVSSAREPKDPGVAGHSYSAPPVTMNEFESEGQALEELIRLIAKTLMEKGIFDEEIENHLNAYRKKREQWKCTNAAASASATLAAPTLLRTRSFSAAVAAPPISSSRLCRKNGAITEVGTTKRRPRIFDCLTGRRQRGSAARQTDALFVQLGEVLAHQYQCTVGVDKDGNVHERELKLLIWRHFVQMVVAVLTDRARFPG
ncbi:unnamed protein product [Bursaphelenchus xylophilus]|uniref:(pine wood nematode) hypothetical protein n=1 Tax=Bursaphelenchus xylophilus TaxID=6326 RepID=A0A1I7SRC7_BURXY|nr:unnamed protein product [Bursaphelenchus xylophilus]CAG9102603.1 unnamed protein product [Bursaphelenchus xylophilus]